MNIRNSTDSQIKVGQDKTEKDYNQIPKNKEIKDCKCWHVFIMVNKTRFSFICRQNYLLELSTLGNH